MNLPSSSTEIADPCFDPETGSSRISVAPMMDCTDRHFRVLMRQLTRHTTLYTEMITTGAILHGNRKQLLEFSPVEHPLVLQLGGDDPDELATCARLGQDFGYDAINLNAGCPSPRVQRGSFGACLMKEPEHLARCLERMARAVEIPVTLKHRIGVDSLDEYADLHRFVKVVSGSGCQTFIVHARIALLEGLSPRENRTIPPLRYQDVFQLKRDFPELKVELNGGIQNMAHVRGCAPHVDGIMIGRAAYQDPCLFAHMDPLLAGDSPPSANRDAIVESMLRYLIDNPAAARTGVVRHMLGLFAGEPGARIWKQHLSNGQPAAIGVLAAIRTARDSVPVDVLKQMLDKAKVH